MTMAGPPEIKQLLDLSARIGNDALLVQASSGNTSIKLGDTLWIKASGKWLAHAAAAEILVPVDLAEFREKGNVNHPGASIETAMHAVLPHRVVIHVHSVNALAWAVRLDARERLAERLNGLDWSWIPYVNSGLPLAQAIEASIHAQPNATVFVLANHGLVVCGESCAAAEDLLHEVEQRLAVPARTSAGFDEGFLSEIVAHFHWTAPDSTALHALATDPVSRRILRDGVLCPCQAVFLGTRIASTQDCEGLSEPPAFAIVEGRGVLTSLRISASQRAILNGLLEIVQRIDAAAPIRYLSDDEVSTLLNEDAHRYRLCAEQNAAGPKSRSNQ
jgi:rhamnose utilization protein RhaD (predicted bifunctional aldolase and dehydrogenase)